jgi:hypothetical protein
MGEDISRSTFNPSKRFSAVRQQQGRVNLDADWNEQIDIAAHRLHTQTRDLFGSSGAPRDNPGFAFTQPDKTVPGVTPAFAGSDAIISPGRIYVAGQLCELSATPAAILNFAGDGTAAAGTQVQLTSIVLDGIPLQPNQWVQISAQGNPAPAAAFAQITAVNAATGSVTFSSSVAGFGSPNTSPQLVRVPTYLTQPDYPSAPQLPASGNAIVYLDVWERTITAQDDPSIQEVALGGPDTTTRTKTLWQLKVLPLPTGTSSACSTPASAIPAWQTAIQPSAGLLTNGVLPSSTPGPCAIATGSGFTGGENQLYRVEIHQPGTISGAAAPITFPLPAGTATFKFSRDNGSLATGVTSIVATSNSTGAPSSQLTVQSTGRDAVLSFASQQWIEITDDFLELSGLPGELHQIDLNGVDQTRSTITLSSPVSSALQSRLTAATSYNPRICRWDQRGQILQAGSGAVWVDLNSAGSTGDIPVPPPGVSLILENGITVSFGLSSVTGTLNIADAWTFAARTATGSIERLVQASPSAIRHSYCRLGSISFDANPWLISDCRHLFAPLADPGIHITGVSLTASGQNLLNDSTISVQQLGTGINISCDGTIDPASVSQPNNTTTPIVSTAQATCLVTVGLPVINGATMFGFQSVALGAAVSLDSTLTTIHWLPLASIISGLTQQMSAIATQIAPAAPVLPVLLAHLTVKGNSIWSADDPTIFLDGETLATPYIDSAGVERSGLLLPSGDGHRGGDFSMWFWLTSPPVPPAITVTTTSLTFAATPVGIASNVLSVIVNNNTAAAAPVTVSSSGDFSQINTSGSPIAANSSCTISVTFKPTAAGPRSGVLTIVSGNLSVTVALAGTGVAFQLQALPSTIDFGVVTVGATSAPQTVTITNIGSATTPVAITGIGTASASYTHSTTCSSLAAGASCSIALQFAPATAGAHPDALTVNTNPPGLLAPIPLSGTGTNPKNAIKDIKDTKNVEDGKDVRDKPKGHLEQIVRPILTASPQLQAAVEPATGAAFIQPAERPVVGTQALEEPK